MRSIKIRNIFLFVLMIRAPIDYFRQYKVAGINVGTIIALLLIGFGFYVFYKSDYKFINNVALSFIIYLMATIPGIVFHGHIVEGVEGVLRVICEISCYYLAYRFCTMDKAFIVKIENAILISSTMPLLLGLYQMNKKIGFYSGDYSEVRIIGTLIHPNMMGFCLIIYALVVIKKIMVEGKSLSEQKFRIVYLALVLFELLKTYSRTSWIGLALIGLFVLVFSKSRNKKYLVIASLLVALLVGENIVSRFVGVTSESIHVSSFASRVMIWENVFTMFSGSPIIGYGLSTFSDLAYQVMGWEIPAHNEYLRILIEAGIIGMFFYLLFMWKSLKWFWENRKVIGSYAFILYLSIHMIAVASNIFEGLVIGIYVWTLLGAWSVSSKALTKEEG